MRMSWIIKQVILCRSTYIIQLLKRSKILAPKMKGELDQRRQDVILVFSSLSWKLLSYFVRVTMWRTFIFAYILHLMVLTIRVNLPSSTIRIQRWLPFDQYLWHYKNGSRLNFSGITHFKTDSTCEMWICQN